MPRRAAWVWKRRDQGFQGEATRTDALEIEPWNRLVDGLCLAQVRRHNLRAEPHNRSAGGVHVWHVLVLPDDPPIQHPRLRHLDRPDAGDQRAGRVMPFADPLAAAGVIHKIGVPLDPVGDLRFNRLPQQALGPRRAESRSAHHGWGLESSSRRRQSLLASPSWSCYSRTSAYAFSIRMGVGGIGPRWG